LEEMNMAGFVKFEAPQDLVNKTYEAVSVAKATGKLRKGVNETTKAIERGIAKLVIMARDVTPEEILMHLPVMCSEKQVPYMYVPSKLELGKASGIEVPTSSIAIVEEGDAKKLISEIAADFKKLSK
jgi:large subunit ribosomal protein L7Ae